MNEEKSLSPEAKAKLDEVEARLRADIKLWTDAGHKIESGDWGLASFDPETGVKSPVVLADPEGCLCPMACVVVGKSTRTTEWDYEAIAAVHLGISAEQVANFVVGFDAAEFSAVNWANDEYYRLGQKFRAELVYC